MKVVRAEFVKSALTPDQYPTDGRPEIAFGGRSNAGKSTLLNILLNRKGLAKTSKKPGKTQMVNFFDINGKVYFVDLPGYGFAKVPKRVQADWGRVMTAYLTGRAPLRLACHLMDARHKPGEQDWDMLELLERAEIPTLIVATKVDKLRPSERQRAVSHIRDALELDKDALIIPYSAISKDGLRDLWRTIDDTLRG
jgi:GTP-binding protein